MKYWAIFSNNNDYDIGYSLYNTEKKLVIFDSDKHYHKEVLCCAVSALHAYNALNFPILTAEEDWQRLKEVVYKLELHFNIKYPIFPLKIGKYLTGKVGDAIFESLNVKLTKNTHQNLITLFANIRETHGDIRRMPLKELIVWQNQIA